MVAPFLAIIMMGMIEISRAVMVVEMLDDAARKGCNTGIKPGKTYAIWLNSPKFGNFKDADGQSAVPYLLVFQTKK